MKNSLNKKQEAWVTERLMDITFLRDILQECIDKYPFTDIKTIPQAITDEIKRLENMLETGNRKALRV